MKKILAIAAVGAMVLLSACTRVGSAEEGVKVINVGGNAGVQAQALSTGRYMNKINEDIFVFPINQQVYHYKEANQLQFLDKGGMEMTGDLAVTLKVRPGSSPKLYERYRKNIHEIAHSEVRMAIMAGVRQAAVKYTAEEIYTGKFQQVLSEALSLPFNDENPDVSIREYFNSQGIEIMTVQWLSNIRIPASVAQAIEEKAAKTQQAEAAKADEVRARAQAGATVATAEGEARAIELRAAALRSSPEVIEQIYAQRSAGLCPPRATTCIIGSGSWGLVPQGNKNSYNYGD